MATHKLGDGNRFVILDDAAIVAVSGDPLLLADLEVSPNEGFTYLAKASGNFTLRFTECDKADGVAFKNNDVTVGASGYSGEFVPGGSLVKVYAFVASGSVDAKIRIFRKGVI